MKAEIAYGKSGVTVYRVRDDGSLFAARVDVRVIGDEFLPAYTEGDNSLVVTTDTMKNFVWAMGHEYEGATLEDFADHLARRFLETWAQLSRLRVRCVELPFARLSRVLYSRADGDRASAEVERSRDGLHDVRCGREGLELMKVTGSSFTRFVRDAYTTLPEIVDRPLAIGLDVHWRYADGADALDGRAGRFVPADAARAAIVEAFDDFNSKSIQQLVHEMGVRMLARFPALSEISFEAQNRTPDAAGEAREGGPKVYTDARPIYGRIGLVLRR